MNFLNAVKQSPIQGLNGFGGGVTNYQFFSGESDPTFPEEVFSINQIQGDGGTGQTIVTGFDLAGEGGLVIFKENEHDADGADPCWYDTVRGNGKLLKTTEAGAETTNSTNPWTPNSTGFNTGDNFGGSENPSSERSTAITFRKCKGFFDVVQYTGSGSNQSISHGLGSTPGFIIVKQYSHDTDSEGNGNGFNAWHRSLGNNKYVNVGAFIGESVTDTSAWNNTAPTSSAFTVGASVKTNDDGRTYIAYIFGHNDASFGTDKDQPIIHCGTYAGTGSADSNGSPKISSLGFEPQFIMSRRYDGGGSSGPLSCVDYINGMTRGGNGWAGSFYTIGGTAASQKSSENLSPGIAPYDDDGAFFQTADPQWNENNQNWIYVAVSQPTMDKDDYENKGTTFTADYVFRDKIADGASKPAFKITNPGWAPDFSYCRGYGNNNQFYSTARLNGPDTRQNKSANGTWEQEYDQETFTDWRYGSTGKSMTTSSQSTSAGGYYTTSRSGSYYSGGMWRKFPKSFSSIMWRGTGSGGASYDHGLGTTPEMLAIGTIESGVPFYFWHKDFTQAGFGNQYYLNWANNENCQDLMEGQISVSSTQYTTSQADMTGKQNTQYWGGFWATVPGVTKVGYYVGNGSDNSIDAGFSNGTKYVMLKRLDSTQTSGNGRWALLSSLSDGQTSNNWKLNGQSQLQSKGMYPSYNDSFTWNYQTFRSTSQGFSFHGDTYNTNDAKFIYYAVAKLPS